MPKALYMCVTVPRCSDQHSLTLLRSNLDRIWSTYSGMWYSNKELIRSLSLVPLFLSHGAFIRAQESLFVTGSIVDSLTREPLPFVNIVVTEANDSSRWAGGATDMDGRFRIGPLGASNYVLRSSSVGYAALQLSFRVQQAPIDLGTLVMRSTSTDLRTHTVEGMQTRVEQFGDTTQYNAGAYKTAPDANAEDLLKKMPGVTQDAEGVKVLGENVRRVLVDGKEFFGDDPNAALKNLPAEIIDKIQVFERQSDQSQFSGFDDGSGSMTINIITKEGMRNGMFGRLYAGHDANELYSTGGNVNIMNGDRRITILGMSNNINQQNFGDQDLLGVASASSGGRGGGQGGRSGRGARGGAGGQGGSANNFLVGPQGGVATTHSFGINYSDRWSKNTEVSGSYFLNIAERDLLTELVREQILPGDSALFYNEAQRRNSRNLNHRMNMRLEHELDSMNSFVLTPRLSIQTNRSDDVTFGTNAFPSGVVDSRTSNVNGSDLAGYTLNTGLLWRHRFAKPKRSFSAQADVEVSDRQSDRLLFSLNLFDLLTDTNLLDRRTDELTNGYRVGGRFSYTEPLGEKHQLQVNYSPNYTSGLTDRVANALDPEFGIYTLLDSTLSNRFASTYFSQRGGASVRRGGEKWSWNLGLEAQYAVLAGEREFPLAFAVDRSFTNLLPNGMIGYTPVKGTSLRLSYRTATREPSIDQLQDVVDISNPLFLRSGNPQLAQSYTHNLMVRFGRTQASKGTSFLALMTMGLTDSYIGTSSTVATNAPVVVDGITIPTGGQLSRPVNLNGAWNGRSFLTYGLPFTKLKSNFNINGGYSFNQLPALINEQVNLANNHTISQGVVLSSNISEQLDFALGYSGNWSFVRNSLQQNADNDYLSSNATFRLQWTTPGNVVIRTNMTYTRFDGLAEGIDADYLLWNASVGYKLLKDRSLEVSLNCFDLLNENNSIARNITETWIEDSRTNVLGRYVMLNLSWNMRHFRQAPAPNEAPDGGRGRG